MEINLFVRQGDQLTLKVDVPLDRLVVPIIGELYRSRTRETVARVIKVETILTYRTYEGETTTTLEQFVKQFNFVV